MLTFIPKLCDVAGLAEVREPSVALKLTKVATDLATVQLSTVNFNTCHYKRRGPQVLSRSNRNERSTRLRDVRGGGRMYYGTAPVTLPIQLRAVC